MHADTWLPGYLDTVVRRDVIYLVTNRESRTVTLLTRPSSSLTRAAGRFLSLSLSLCLTNCQILMQSISADEMIRAVAALINSVSWDGQIDLRNDRQKGWPKFFGSFAILKFPPNEIVSQRRLSAFLSEIARQGVGVLCHSRQDPFGLILRGKY